MVFVYWDIAILLHTRALLQRSASKGRQDERSLVDLLVIVFAQLLFFLSSEGTERCGDITVGVLAADHEPNLARGVGGDCSVSVLNGWEDFLTILLELSDQWEVEPLVLG